MISFHSQDGSTNVNIATKYTKVHSLIEKKVTLSLWLRISARFTRVDDVNDPMMVAECTAAVKSLSYAEVEDKREHAKSSALLTFGFMVLLS